MPSGSALPNADSTCAAGITPNSWEPRPENFTANHSTPTLPVNWSDAELGPYWAKWIAKRNKVTGQFTGTTTEILQWGACKWGLEEDLLRAVAVQESDWRQSADKYPSCV